MLAKDEYCQCPIQTQVLSSSTQKGYQAVDCHYRQVPTQALLLGGCQHPVSTPSVDTYLNDIRFGRCQRWVSTLGVNTYQRRYCFGRC